MYTRDRDAQINLIRNTKLPNGAFAKKVTDLTNDQLFWGGSIISNYSKYLVDRQAYVNKLKEAWDA
ncbi:MAG: hypothetical protein ACFFKA_10560 [Candidatus Thorarchaeota archaeon]